ncbi:PPE family protein [Mycobacterium camsae]|uniref:PPE family protein n=1 Tax=Mycobacterium gordonae TaxID=1778 RepID=UPI001981BE34|nr:PPE family protein [Mycobacterium gordonae]
MDFTVFPPEINSALIYGGAGASPMYFAAAAWEGLAADLRASATSFDSVIAGLIGGPWGGSASISMTAAAAPYVGWLTVVAGQAESSAAQARLAATTYEAALAATVHPAAVASNRVSLLSLIATNFLGQNTPAIAATDFDYLEMWAQDVAAMLGYQADASSVAAALPSFTLPPLDFAALEPGASGQIAGAVSASQSLLAAVPVSTLSSAGQALMTPAGMAMSPMMSLFSNATRGGATGLTAAEPLEGATRFDGASLPAAKPMSYAGQAVSAGLGHARMLGPLSVPPTWAGPTPARAAASALSGLHGAAMAAAPEMPAAATGAGGLPMMPMPTGGMSGAAGGTPAGMAVRGGGGSHVVQSRPSVVPRVGLG